MAEYTSVTTKLVCNFCGKPVEGGFCGTAAEAAHCPYKASADTLAERRRCAAIARSYDNPRGTIGNEMNALAVKIAEEIERGE